MNKMILSEEAKIPWDIFVFFTIIISAFETPFSFVVGWGNAHIDLFFDTLYYAVFGLDLMLNFLTERTPNFNGFLGWRKIIGLLIPKVSPEYIKSELKIEKLNKMKAISWSYMTSFSFYVDLVSIVPLEIILGQIAPVQLVKLFRLSRIPRVAKLLKSIHAVKIFSGHHTYKKMLKINPSKMRFIFMLVIVPLFIHILSCLYLLDFGANVNLKTYFDTVYIVTVDLLTIGHTQRVTKLGMLLNIVSLLGSLTIIAAFVGNITSLFFELDEATKEIDVKKKKWRLVFKEYPKQFESPDLRRKIMTSVEVQAHVRHSLTEMLDDLPLDLQEEIKEAVIKLENS